MKAGSFLVILFFIFNLLALNILPSSDCTHARNIVSVENLNVLGMAQISKDYFAASPNANDIVSRSKSQIPSWQGSLFLRLLQQIDPSTGPFLSEAFLPPSTVSKVVLTTILRC